MYTLNNGRTLCHGCHSETETYGAKIRKTLDKLRASKSSDNTNASNVPSDVICNIPIDVHFGINTNDIGQHCI